MRSSLRPRMKNNTDCDTSKAIFNFYFPLILIAILLTPLSINAETENNSGFINISRSEYLNKLQGFWLGQNIANWTGLITEMDKVGTPQTLPFYTDKDWGKPDQKAIWGSSYHTQIPLIFTSNTQEHLGDLMTTLILSICMHTSTTR